MNNLFSFATSELSQDAFICWSMNWLNDPRKPELVQMSKKLVSLFSGVENIGSVEVFRQYGNVDILLVVNKNIAVLIESKVFTSEHSDQIRRYRELIDKDIKENGVLKLKRYKNFKEEEIEYEIHEIRSVYFKTGFIRPEDEKINSLEDMGFVNRSDVLRIVNEYKEESDIVFDYYQYLSDLDSWYETCKENYEAGNYFEAFQDGYGQLLCMKDLFKDKIKIGDLPETDILLTTGSSYGRPYTWAWVWDKEDLFWLGYRLDCNNDGYFLSLRLYRKCKKDENREEILREKEEIYECMKGELEHLLEESPLRAVLAGNRAKYNESELAKFYFKNNSISELKEHLISITRKMINAYTASKD